MWKENTRTRLGCDSSSKFGAFRRAFFLVSILSWIASLYALITLFHPFGVLVLPFHWMCLCQPNSRLRIRSGIPDFEKRWSIALQKDNDALAPRLSTSPVHRYLYPWPVFRDYGCFWIYLEVYRKMSPHCQNAPLYGKCRRKIGYFASKHQISVVQTERKLRRTLFDCNSGSKSDAFFPASFFALISRIFWSITALYALSTLSHPFGLLVLSFHWRCPR